MALGRQFVKVTTRKGEVNTYENHWTNEDDDSFWIYENEEPLSSLKPGELPKLTLRKVFAKVDLQEVIMDGVVVFP